MKYEYTIVRSARRTLAATLSSTDNKITVRAPYSVSVAQIESFLESRSDWFDKKMAVNAVAIGLNECVINLQKVYIGGVIYGLSVGEKRAFDGKTLYIERMSDIKNAVIALCGERFERRFREVAARMRLDYGNVGFRSYKSRWGCCDSHKNITFNYKLLMLPDRLQLYVIVHELCHTVHMNHSDAFYSLVGRFLPDYRTRRSDMKKFSFLTRLYP